MPARAIASALLIAVFAGCTPPFVSPFSAGKMMEKAKDRPLLVGFEGLQPFSGDRAETVCAAVAEGLDMAHTTTSGNYLAHIGFVRQAHRHHQPIYIVGYSMGSAAAVQLAQWCKLSGIAVRIVLLLDPAVLPGRVPDNVGAVVVVQSSSIQLWPHTNVTKGWLADPDKTWLEVIDLPGTEHTMLPYEASIAIRARIGADLDRR